MFGYGSSREAGVIVRATVEAFGPVGDTELTVHVKWPAGSTGMQRIVEQLAASPEEESTKPLPDGALSARNPRRPPPLT